MNSNLSINKKTKKKKQTNNNKKTATALVKQAATALSRAEGKPRRKKNKGNGRSPLLNSYLLALNDPFRHAPPHVGFGALGPCGRATSYTRTTVAAAAVTHYVYLFRPQLKEQVVSYATTNPATAVVLGTVTAYDAVNATSIRSSGADARCIAAGLRVGLRVPATSAPPVIYMAPYVNDSLSTLSALSINNLIALPSFYPVMDPDCGGQCNWRPEDVTDFEFLQATVNTAGYGDSFAQSMCVIVVTNVPIGGSVISETIMHLETQGGLLGGAQDVPGSSISDEVPNVESVFSKLRNLLTPSIELNEYTTGLLEKAQTNFLRSAGNQFVRLMEGTNSRLQLETVHPIDKPEEKESPKQRGGDYEIVA